MKDEISYCSIPIMLTLSKKFCEVNLTRISPLDKTDFCPQVSFLAQDSSLNRIHDQGSFKIVDFLDYPYL
ncbi:MAG: hypothetical protein DA329_06300 [Candidatus Nitrosocosmicus sp.]|nr:hypothetical protein [Candidatus Nitrosocosmicus sp.]